MKKHFQFKFWYFFFHILQYIVFFSSLILIVCIDLMSSLKILSLEQLKVSVPKRAILETIIDLEVTFPQAKFQLC